MQGRSALIASLLALSLFASPAAIAAQPSFDRNLGFTSYSLNWSGYAVLAGSSTVTAASGSWTVPAVTCAKGSSYVAFWVGIDGANSGTVEQTGTLGQCFGGVPSYSAWYEFYPAASITISSIAVRPGDVFSASVTYSSGTFHLTITDQTTGQTFSTSGTVSGAQRSSAECVAERPSIGGSITKLAKFGVVNFTQCSATISGVSNVFGSFAGVAQIDMVGRSGRLLAQTSSLSGGSSFSVTWKAAN